MDANVVGLILLVPVNAKQLASVMKKIFTIQSVHSHVYLHGLVGVYKKKF
jgi:hypothetical protein